MKYFFLSVLLMLAGCNHLVQHGINSSRLAPHPDPQATIVQTSSPDLIFTTHLINALIVLAADPYTAYLATTSAIRVAIDAHLTKYKVYLARLTASLAAVFFAEDYVLLRAMRNTARADAYAVDVVADPEFVAHDASNDVLTAASADDIDDDDPVVYAARAVDDAYTAAKLAIDATDAPDLLLVPLVATAATAANDRIKAIILLDKAKLKRIHAAATHANYVAASANVVDAHDKVTTEAVANLAKTLHASAKRDAEFTKNLADAAAKNAYNSNVATFHLLRDALSRVPSDMGHLTLPVRLVRTVLDVHLIRAFPNSAISSE